MPTSPHRKRLPRLDRVLVPLVPLLALLAGGCAASRPIGAATLGAGGAYLAHELSGGDPALTAAGAAGGVLVSEGLHYLGRRATARAYAAGYDKGRSDAVRQQYWIQVNLQKERQPAGQLRLLPVHLPEQHIDGAIFQPTVKYLRIEE